ncbi:MAG TPA: TPM domain-containing protein [Mariniphaga anaerophila]|uniref:TPM domain-containing protein n=1 Tax=Mariniphaga anaerophila TaxID=1484053 RepID=A0A831LLT3_9BACT|nr:TPM domain-containing protein [Mariniphaga anaerophila]
MKKLLSILILLSGITALHAEIPERPVPPRLVNDFAGVLSPAEASALESKLVQFDRETSTQIVLVAVNDLEGYDPGDYAFRLGEKWGVGQQGKDNGLVILLKPKTGNDRGRIFIATGYGLEGVLPDAIVNGAIIDTEMIPQFERNNYYKGLENGINVIMDITRGEYTAEYYRENYARKSGGLPVLAIFFILFFVIIPILRGRSRRFYSPGKDLPLWIALGMMSGNRSHGSSFGNFSSGSGSFGGGGFGGFGGGSFGGGGAGGSW